jgi:hypothetical protein
VLGATIMCQRAGELIHEPALVMRTDMFTGRLAQTVHAYPTWSIASSRRRRSSSAVTVDTPHAARVSHTGSDRRA